MVHRSYLRKALPSCALGLVVLIGTAATGFAQNNDQSKSTTAVKPANTTVSGQHAAIDPVTRQLRQPTAAEAQALAAQMKAGQSKKALKVVKRQNGSKSVAVGDQFMETMVARVNADGSVSQACVKTSTEAEAFLTADQKKAATKPAAAPAEEER